MANGANGNGWWKSLLVLILGGAALASVGALATAWRTQAVMAEQYATMRGIDALQTAELRRLDERVDDLLFRLSLLEERYTVAATRLTNASERLSVIEKQYQAVGWQIETMHQRLLRLERHSPPRAGGDEPG